MVCICGFMLAGDLSFLEASDVELLNLPMLAKETVETYIQLGMSKPPIVFDFASRLPDLSVKVTKPGNATLLLIDLLCFYCFDFAELLHSKRLTLVQWFAEPAG